MAARRGLLAAALILVAFNLRPFLASAPAVEDDIRAAFGLSGATTGLLTTLPVLCFALCSPIAPGLARRRPGETVLLAAMVLLAVCTAGRALDGTAVLFAGTIGAGIAVAVANVLMPSIVKARFPTRQGLMVGLYAAAMNIGAAVAAGATVPVSDAAGTWRVGLAVWAAPALVAAAALRAARGARRGSGAVAHVDRVHGLWRDRRARQVTLFLGFQSFIFYFGLAWIPAILRDAGFSDAEAGVALSLFTLLGTPTALLVPVLAGRMRSQAPLAAAGVLLLSGGIAGLLFAPGAGYAWATIAGIGQGAGIGLALMLFTLRTPDERHAAELSGLAQGAGYLLAAVGPLAMGALHDATGGWDLPLALVLACGIPMLWAGSAAGQPGRVGARPHAGGHV